MNAHDLDNILALLQDASLPAEKQEQIGGVQARGGTPFSTLIPELDACAVLFVRRGPNQELLSLGLHNSGRDLLRVLGDDALSRKLVVQLASSQEFTAEALRDAAQSVIA